MWIVHIIIHRARMHITPTFSRRLFLSFFLSFFLQFHSCSSRCPQSSLSLNRFTLNYAGKASQERSESRTKSNYRWSGDRRGSVLSVKRRSVSSVEWDCVSCCLVTFVLLPPKFRIKSEHNIQSFLEMLHIYIKKTDFVSSKVCFVALNHVSLSVLYVYFLHHIWLAASEILTPV